MTVLGIAIAFLAVSLLIAAAVYYVARREFIERHALEVRNLDV